MTNDSTRTTGPDELAPRQFRALTTEWTGFGQATSTQHPQDGRGARALVLRQLMAWYMRRPGARLPERPPAGPWSTPPANDAEGTHR
ncbi:hypothetical protein AB0P17_36495 [Streptomyces sp. NPDC088124]|uniref:hypothetical protein n=1 Tax=Streptomyces sp. NPDC088124 TaxID=3154654 RepID=UPI00344AEB3F